MPESARPPHPAPHWPLQQKLVAVLLALTTGLGVLLFTVSGPRTAAAFAQLGDDYLAEGSTAMRELVHEQSLHTNDLVVDLLARTIADRERSLRELPLDDAASGDTIRRTIAADDARRSVHDRQQATFATAAAEGRANAAIDARLRALSAAQAARTAEFVADQRADQLWLLGTAFVALLLALGLSQHRFVLRPVRRLRDAAGRVADGELAVSLPDAGADEIGDLTRSFARMVTQLADARAAQQRLADGLAEQVATKTAHLERALADLRASHAQLAAAERLAALGTLAGGVAHEFHNLIGGIRGCARELAHDEADPDRKETLAVIGRAADRGTTIVQQLSRFARRTVERVEDVDPAAVVGDALLLCEPAARRQHVAVERELGKGLRLAADADGLHQVCVNLLVNALQAMPDGGTLRVTLRRDGPAIALSIADTGVGIAKEHLARVFEPFFTTKGDASDPAARGSGLGLSVSWGIVQAHGGRIDVQSSPGQGTTFTVWLPDRPPAR